MVSVYPDRILGGLVQIFGIRTIVHNPVVHRQATGIVYRPSDNRQIATHQRYFWPLADLYPLGSWSDWTFLSEQAAAQEHYRQCQKHFVHNVHLKQKSLKLIEGKVTKVNRHRCFVRLVRSHLKFCETDEPEKKRH